MTDILYVLRNSTRNMNCQERPFNHWATCSFWSSVALSIHHETYSRICMIFYYSFFFSSMHALIKALVRVVLKAVTGHYVAFEFAFFYAIKKEVKQM